jgi:hypothetical protein
MQLEKDRGATPFDSLDEHQFPEGTIPVEVREAHPPRLLEQFVPTASAGQTHTSQVKIEIEVRIHGKPRRGDPEDAPQGPLAQHGNHEGEALYPGAQALPVRCTVEQYERDNGGA